MKTLYTVFFLFIALFLVQQLLVLLQTDVPTWVLYYLNDFLCMPIVLTISLTAVHVLKKDTTIRLSLFPIFTLTLFYAVYFEWYLPQVEPRYTADIVDVILYFGGALLFYFIQHRK